jgi:hypothetical protein
MSKRETLTAKGAGEVLAGPAMSASEATGRVRRWQMAGIIPTVGQQPDGRAAFLFDQAAPAIAAVLFWAHDHAGIIDRPTLATFWRFLADPHHEHCVPAIDHVLAEVMAGGAPVLVLTRWGNATTGEVLTTTALRFDDEYERPIASPAPCFEVLADIVLELAPLLERFVGSNVMPFASGAVH